MQNNAAGIRSYSGSSVVNDTIMYSDSGNTNADIYSAVLVNGPITIHNLTVTGYTLSAGLGPVRPYSRASINKIYLD